MALNAVVLEIDGESVATLLDCCSDFIDGKMKVFLCIDPLKRCEVDWFDLLTERLCDFQLVSRLEVGRYQGMFVLDAWVKLCHRYKWLSFDDVARVGLKVALKYVACNVDDFLGRFDEFTQDCGHVIAIFEHTVVQCFHIISV